MRSGYWKLGTWQDIPFYLHWSVLLWLPLYWSSYPDPAWAILSMFAFLSLLLAHEAGHAVAAMSCGLRVHAIEARLFGGLCWHEAAYSERDDVLVAWGGVLAQACVLLIAVLAEKVLWRGYPDLAYSLMPLFYVFIKANVVIAAVNLLPVPPLDGYRAWRAFPMLWEYLSSGTAQRPRTGGNVTPFGRRGGFLDDVRRAIAHLLERLKGK
ncbi:MAG TPA: M50 family metallopeptidase [Gallionellaceae bacterium]|nr:M50 family metallopeptidase [Gallionellaceae bacterium]